MANFLTQPPFSDIILPFLLVFVLIYAILEKTRIFGEDKHQIDAVTAIIVAGILIGFSTQLVWIKNFIVFLVIALVILFIFMLLYGFAFAGKEGFVMSNRVKITIATVAAIGVIIAGVIITGYRDWVLNFFTGGSTLGSNLIFAVVIAAVIVSVVVAGRKKSTT